LSLPLSVCVARLAGAEPLHAEQASDIAVTVQGDSKAQRLRQSAEAVQVIDNDVARKRTSDLGEVMARAAGITVQRAGGLGSETRFSLNGLEGDQIRFFMDGVPLGLAGFSFGLANVPVSIVERIEVYRGVVPIRFGADALGGAVNLVSREVAAGSSAAASYQGGSFDTHQVTAQASHAFERHGLFVRASVFGDSTQNDYPVDVDVVDASGRQSRARVHRFHDAYGARGAFVEAGWRRRPFARLLSLRVFATDSEKELQHDPLMLTPYGEVESSTSSAGGYVRYEAHLGRTLSLSSVGGYAFGRVGFVDVSSCIYDWYGQCTRQRVTPGEIENVPRDNRIDSHAAFGRASLAWLAGDGHTLRLAAAPDLVVRSGNERRPRTLSGVDPLDARRLLVSTVTGIEYQLALWDDRLENIAFAKSYLQISRSERPLPAGGTEAQDRDTQRFGVGDALRFRFQDGLWGKASYEYATRLPQADEVFGDGALTEENLDLAPESSHNYNVGLSFDSRATSAGTFWLDANAFYRDATELIRRVGAAVYFSYQNVAAARTLGVDGTLRWVSPGSYAALNGNLTFQDSRNTSTAGTYAAQRGDRIPNRPYLFGSASLELRYPDLVSAGDSLSTTWSSRYVHEFFRTWESLGALESKPRVDAQLIHSVGLSYAFDGAPAAVATALEMHNVTNARVYDFFGVQRPGRAVFFKTTLEL
jgi:vitamin B12 transporter